MKEKFKISYKNFQKIIYLLRPLPIVLPTYLYYEKIPFSNFATCDICNYFLKFFNNSEEPVKFTPEVAAIEKSFDERLNTRKRESTLEHKALTENHDLNSTVSSSKDYDLEETIRIIHGMELAKKQSANFNEYLAFLAKQDYSEVATDVIQAKKNLLPILNKLKLAEKELEDEKELWALFSKVEEVVFTEAVLLSANIQMGNHTGAAANFVSIAGSTFKSFKEQKLVQKALKRDIDQIEMEYISYLEKFTPVYLKYMKEWDKVCLYRDNAYLAIHQQNITGAMESLDQALKVNPRDKEALILKAYSLLYKEQQKQHHRPLVQNVNELDMASAVTGNFPSSITSKEDEVEVEEKIGNAEQAKEILENYIVNFPDRSAPALLLLGTYNYLKGDYKEAMRFYDQSAVEYPRQSAQLLDMLNSYKQRSYLRRSAEGGYILELYKSTMEGYGFFSPNFQKAFIEANNQNFENSKEEILKHFFRRGNQHVFDYLISDMQHCENYLSESFDLIFQEKSFLNLEATPKMWNSDELNIKVVNNSDIRLSNVRLFLAVHFTDMYKDDYEVFKVENTLSSIEPFSEADFGDVELDFEIYGKKKSADKDIVNIRAIMVTNNRVSYIDQQDFKINKIWEQLLNNQTATRNFSGLQKYHDAIGFDWNKVCEIIEEKSEFEFSSSLIGKDKIKIKLPRDLVNLNPFFSINHLALTEV